MSRALKLSQDEIRQALEIVGAVAKIEKRADMHAPPLRQGYGRRARLEIVIALITRSRSGIADLNEKERA
jgi:hypothetical protein